jgi:hypothetical protein
MSHWEHALPCLRLSNDENVLPKLKPTKNIDYTIQPTSRLYSNACLNQLQPPKPLIKRSATYPNDSTPTSFSSSLRSSSLSGIRVIHHRGRPPAKPPLRCSSTPSPRRSSYSPLPTSRTRRQHSRPGPKTPSRSNTAPSMNSTKPP